jgi:phosphoglycerate dehydrogenase-like enzyme
MTRVAVLDDYQLVAAGLADWSHLGAEVTFFSDHLDRHHELAERLRPFEVIVAMRERTPFDRALLAALPNLRLLVTTGMRNAAIDLEAAEESGVIVAGTSSPGTSTSELTLALILILARSLVDEIESVRTGGWQVGLGRQLGGASLGVIGLGKQGRAVAKLGQALGMKLSAWSANLTAEQATAVGAELTSLEELLAGSDFVTIHLRLSDRTRGLIGRPELTLMKPTAYLINTSRGEIVDRGALIEALDRGTIAGVGLDVYDVEPLPVDDPLRSHPKVVATPHLGYVSAETYEVFYREAVEDIAAWQQGTPIRVLTS